MNHGTTQTGVSPMGATTGFLIASQLDAVRIADLFEFAASESGLVQNAIHDVEMEALEKVLLGPTDQQWLERTLTHTASDEGPWVFCLPDQFTTRLAALTPGEVFAIGTDWAKAMSDPRWFPGWSAADLEESCLLFVGDLAGIASRAVAAGQPILMWMCM